MPIKTSIKTHLDKYLALRSKIDAACENLLAQHYKNMQCKSGCSSCCQAFKILPIEYESIKASIGNLSLIINKKAKKDECKFLVDNKCSIYEHRPVICRSHGYPMARFNEEYDAYDMSYCKLNFIDFLLEKFNADNVYFEDDFNARLYKLNQDFLKVIPEKDYDPIQLIELNDIADELVKI